MEMDNEFLWFWSVLAIGFLVVLVWLGGQLRIAGSGKNGWKILTKRICGWQRDVPEKLQTVEDDLNASPPIRFAENRQPARIKKRILRWFRAVDQEELSNLRQQFEDQGLELSARIDRLEVTLTNQGRLENWARDVNGRLCQLELSQKPHREKGAPLLSHSKSILCLGVRVTLTDQIWHELGQANPQDLPDSQISKFIQGPFCRNCLRSLVVHNAKDHEKFVRAQCRYCSLAWREDSSLPMSLRQIKREAYEYLDAAYRSRRDTTL